MNTIMINGVTFGTILEILVQWGKAILLHAIALMAIIAVIALVLDYFSLKKKENLKSIICPITNNKIKNRFINLIILYRINYFEHYRITNFDKNVYNKILNKQFLNKSELKILNKCI